MEHYHQVKPSRKAFTQLTTPAAVSNASFGSPAIRSGRFEKEHLIEK